MANTAEAQDRLPYIVKKVRARLLPLMMVMYAICYIDKVNVGFAGLQMRDALNLSATAFGFGAGVFFIGYTLFEVPSNLILHRVGARIWMARIMFTWGLLSAAMAFTQGETSFYVLRFLLGAAEAGFFPGMMMYMMYWFPQSERARIVGNFMIAVPISVVIASPVSGVLLELDGLLNLGGWQWLFIIEGAPAVLLAFVAHRYLTDKPDEAKWLTAEERSILSQKIAEEDRARVAKQHFTILQALAHPRIILFGVLYFGLLMANNGVVIWMPQVVKTFGFVQSNFAISSIVAIPYIVTVFAVLFWSKHSDKTGERIWHVAIPAFIATSGLILTALSSYPPIQLFGLTMALAGIFSAMPPFWALPTSFLSGAAAAGGLAFITTIAQFGGLVGPTLNGYVTEVTGNYSAGMASLGAGTFFTGILVLTQLWSFKAVKPRAAQPAPAAE